MIEALAREKWESSGLDENQARALKLKGLTGDQVAKLAPNFHRVGALHIPYFDPKGTPTKFFRIRYLEKLNGFAGVVGKPQRYAQPKGSLNEVYMPPLLTMSWAEVLQDVNIPIYITEGELKAAAGCSCGLATIGLGGVDVWRAAKRGIVLLPALAQAKWTKRTVVIVYDSDAATNPNVVRAQRQLAAELMALGALAAVCSISPGPHGEKVGLDDYLMAQGAESLITLLNSAPLFPEADALWGMNEEVLYVKYPGLVVTRAEGERISAHAFVHHVYANHHYQESKPTKSGGIALVNKPLAKRWIEWEHRFEVKRITYAPGKPQITDDAWNTWPGMGVEPAKGDIMPWQSLLDYVFASAGPEEREWFEKWCAYPIQYPGTKLFTAAVIWGRYQGTGKTLIAYTLRNIYGKNFVEIKSNNLVGSFNSWAENRQLVYGDEITGSDSRIDADRLKGMITNEELMINAKFLPEYVIPDCINYYFTSNHPDAFFIEDSDRRFFVHELVGPPMAREFYTKYDAWMKGPGPAALYHYLLSLDLSDFDPRAPAMITKSKASMIVDAKSDVAMWVVQLREDPDAALRTLGEHIAQNAELLTATMLLRAYDPEGKGRVTVNGLSRELKRSGFVQCNYGSPIRTATGLQRVYAIRNIDKWEEASPSALAQEYNRVFPPPTQKF
jgi:hypothetical protein